MSGDPINPKAPVVSNIAVCAVAISKDVAENLDVDVTPSTIRRRLREKGPKSCKTFVSHRNRARSPSPMGQRACPQDPSAVGEGVMVRRKPFSA